MEMKIIIRGGVITPIVEVDNQIIYSKKDKYGTNIFTFNTQNSVCNVRIYSLKHELSEKYWWLFAFLFYLVSIFGIFNTRYNKNFYSLDYQGVISANQPELELSLNQPTNNGKALTCKNGEFHENPTNVYTYDEKAKKRRKLCLALKIISWIVILAIVIIVLIFK